MEEREGQVESRTMGDILACQALDQREALGALVH